jgi:asparagine synthase (glutamine-hydrolysing)
LHFYVPLRRHFMSCYPDVPKSLGNRRKLGAFLSGGVDSSLIAALMARRSPGKVQTFSIGFESGTGVDETEHARKVARHLGTEHHELVLTPKNLLHAERVFETMNEPVADPTVLPTAILSRFARERVKVALTGEGGDELFAGYNRHCQEKPGQSILSRNISPQ